MGAPKPRPAKIVQLVGKDTVLFRDPVTYVRPASLAEIDAVVIPSSDLNRVRVTHSYHKHVFLGISNQDTR